MVTFELLVVAVLIVLNGVLAMSELAVVSSRIPRLKALAASGRKGASAALKLASDPGRFLSTVQIGISLIGVLAGAFSGATLATRLTVVLEDGGVSPRFADPLAFGLVVGAITYLSLIIGELVPKQLALRNPEAMASTIAPTMVLLSRLCAPLVYVLYISQDTILRLLGARGERASNVTDEEIKTLVAEAETAGVLDPEERRMIAGVMRLADRSIAAIMTPRPDVDWVDLADDEETIRRTVFDSRRSRLPAMDEEGIPVGVVQAKDMLNVLLSGEPLKIRELVREAPVVIDTFGALAALERLRTSQVPMALVHDEYGNFEGIVTPADLLSGIAGTFHQGENEDEEPGIVERGDGSFLIGGSLPADELADLLNLQLDPDRDYHTVAGFVLSVLKSLPQVGEAFEWQGWRFEIVDLDGPRIDKVLVARAPLTHRRG
ncbi:MAG: HlyC/CorC family transporter [Chelatococcus sp.]|jgi:putative hemolysin|uniref:hemolysin family protein n=1 Tax=Chelatococcus sp. TaxID=1953771 RepID=UPI0025BEAE55|nr:hemolysin family protein [Chelatococcus sp.]MBX3536346.1 HlyC/CorC family transporter [Chelatococcus sp.]